MSAALKADIAWLEEGGLKVSPGQKPDGPALTAGTLIENARVNGSCIAAKRRMATANAGLQVAGVLDGFVQL